MDNSEKLVEWSSSSTNSKFGKDVHLMSGADARCCGSPGLVNG